MNGMKLGICILDTDDNILAHKSISTGWSIELKEDMQKCHDIEIEEEAALFMWDYMKANVTPEMIKKLIKEAQSTEKGNE